MKCADYEWGLDLREGSPKHFVLQKGYVFRAAQKISSESALVLNIIVLAGVWQIRAEKLECGLAELKFAWNDNYRFGVSFGDFF